MHRVASRVNTMRRRDASCGSWYVIQVDNKTGQRYFYTMARGGIFYIVISRYRHIYNTCATLIFISR